MPSTPAVEAVAGVGKERDGLKMAGDGNIVGREGPRRDMKVLGRVSWRCGFQEQLIVPFYGCHQYRISGCT